MLEILETLFRITFECQIFFKILIKKIVSLKIFKKNVDKHIFRIYLLLILGSVSNIFNTKKQ